MQIAAQIARQKTQFTHEEFVQRRYSFILHMDQQQPLYQCPLTTVGIPWFEMGIKAANMLLNRISGVDTTSEVIITLELVARESTPPVQG